MSPLILAPEFINHPQGDPSFYGDIVTAELTDNLQIVLDAGSADSYPGSGQSWLDLSGNGHDFFFGDTSSPTTDDPTFNGSAGDLSSAEYMSFDGGDHFGYDTAIPSWAMDMYKNNSDPEYTIAAWVHVPNVAPDQTIFGTWNSNGDYGTGFLITGNEKQQIRARTNGVTLSIIADTALSTGAWHFMAISLNEDGGSTGAFFYLDGAYDQVGSSDQWNPSHSLSNESAGNQEMVIGKFGTKNVNYFANGSRIAGLMVWNGAGSALTKAELDLLWAAGRDRFGL